MATISENLQTLNNIKQDIKTAIENKGQDLTNVPFSQYAEKIDAIETGSTSEDSYYDTFWDSFQENGKRTNYLYAFNGVGWNDDTFKPKYNIVPDGSSNYNMFRNTKITNLKAILEQCGVQLDTSKCGYTLAWFMQSSITHVPRLDLQKANPVLILREGENVEYVDGFHLNPNGGQYFNTSKTSTSASSSAFYNCKALKHCVFTGKIDGIYFNMQWSPMLDKESITSVINCLSTETSDLTVTLSEIAVNKAFETSEGANDGSNSSEWKTLVDTKTNWTINLL